MERAAAALCAAASRPYRAAGRFPYHYARSKLRFDAVFLTILQRKLIPDDARLLDLGCGQALLAAVLLAASHQFATGVWPSGWPSPPANPILHGIELDDLAQWGRIALGENVRIETGDISLTALPCADVIVLLDVLHYLDANAQVQLLEKIARSLPRGGRLLMRVADASAGSAFHLTRLLDRLGTLTRSGRLRSRLPRLTFRTVLQWTALLRELGFRVAVQPGDGRGPNANVLLHARLP
jgi:SAM-dependent methyltransferase